VEKVVSTRLKLVDSETGVIDRALEIAQKRRNTLVLLKTAIREGDLAESDRLITELVPDEKSYRTNPSVHRITGR
jgi:hypothetical protein